MSSRVSRSAQPLSPTLRRVWLAGLGALSQAAGSKRGEELLRELVHRGEEIEAQGKGLAVSELEPQPSESEIIEEGRLILAWARVIDSDARQRRDTERLIQAMLPEGPPPTPPAVLQARRNAEAREELISEFGLLSSSDIASRAGSKAKNKAALANRWKQEGRIFSVPHHGTASYPAFQFDDEGQPLPVIASILSSIGRQSRGWELALWFIAANGWLGSRRPVDLLRSEPETVVRAAEREAEGLFF
jgi:poly(hydroxyalkanoate) granule associated protein phasin